MTKRLLLAIAFLAAPALVCAQPADPLPRLLRQLKSKNDDRRSAAFSQVASLGPKASAAIPVLIGFLGKFDEGDRIQAALALGKIGKPALTFIEPLLDNEDETTRYYAVWALGQMGSDAKPLTARLLRIAAPGSASAMCRKAGTCFRA